MSQRPVRAHSKNRRSAAATALAARPVLEALEGRLLFNGTNESPPPTPQPPGALSIENGDPVRFDDGVAVVNATDLSSSGLGVTWGMSRTWNNGTYDLPSRVVGTNWTVSNLPQLLNEGGGWFAALDGNGNTRWFQQHGSAPYTYTPRLYLQDVFKQVTLPDGSHEFTLTDPQGTTIHYTDFSSTNTIQRGQFKSETDAYGNTIAVVSYTSDGRIQEVQRTSASGGVTESYLYTYLVAPDPNPGQLGQLTERRGTSTSGPWTTVRQVVYDYYREGDANGVAGDLRTAKIEDAAGNVIDTDYYRTYHTTGGTGVRHYLKYVLEGEGYARASAALGGDAAVLAASDAAVAPYADYYFEYDSSDRVTKQVVRGFGASASGGLGTFTFSYATPSTASTVYGTANFNLWKYETIVTNPDGTTNTVYTNAYGQVILEDYTDASGQNWDTYAKYDSQGRTLEIAQPAAVAGFTTDTSGDLTPSFNTTGRIDLTDYYATTSPTISETVAGGVAGYMEDTKVANGSSGLSSPVLLTKYDFYKRTANGITTFPTADTTVYRNTDGTGAETTHDSYTWYSGTVGIQSMTVNPPVVSTAQNGPNTSDQKTTYYDTYGRAIWTQDGEGYLNYTAYDDATGAVLQTIIGVDTSATGAPTQPPITWPVTVRDGPNLTTTDVVDPLGRTTEETSPNGNVTYTVYKDLGGVHEVRVYPGWNASTGTTTGPVQVTRDDPTHSDTQTFTFAPAAGSLANPPDGTEAVTNLQTLSVGRTNASGQNTETDQYFDLSGLTYSTAAVLSGAVAGTNYYATQYGYDVNGLQNHVKAPTGTITDAVYDGLGRLVSTSVGTNDTTANNMIVVSEDQYDNGGVGDGNLTQVTTHPGGGQPDRVTQYFYDWRDRQVAEKDGVQSSESDGTHRPIDFTTYDNLSEPIETQQFDGDGVTITSTGGVPNAPSSSLLRAQSTTSYDDQGRPYVTKTYSVDPSTGTVSSSALTTNVFYDHRGNVIETIAPGGLVTKNQYDGGDRLIETAQTDGAGGTGWSNAGGLVGDNVLSETLTQYDADSNVVLMTTKQRFHNETATGELGDAMTGPLARVSYSADYYDTTDRLTKSVDIGTNGGSTFTYNPSSPPTRSDNALTTDYSYNPAGWVEIATDPRGIENKTLYDALGRTVTTIADYTGGTPTDSTDQTTSYTYDGDGHTVTMTAVMPSGTPSQTTQYVYGVSGGTITSNDLLATIEYPDKTTGNPSTSAADDESYTYNALGEATSKTDRNGNVHSYSYDVLGRQTSDSVTTLGSGVDGEVRRIDTAYNSAGQAYLFTSYADTAGTTVVNQVEDVFNGLGQLGTEYQANSGAVDTSTTPQVNYAYSSPATGSRAASITYPDGREIDYNYASGIDSTIGRLSSLSDSSGTLESYAYLGLGTVVERAHPQNATALTYISSGTGDAGDQYTGLDRFGRVVDQNWVNTTTGTSIDESTYTYDADSNPLTKGNPLSTANDETYSYDDLNRLATFARGTSGTTQSWDSDAVGNWNSVTTDGTATTRTNNSQNQIVTTGSSTLAYDNAGNTTTDENGGALTYDAWNRLRSYTPSGGATVYYGYDALGRRTFEDSPNSDGSSSSATHLYYSNNWQVIQEAGPNNRENVWSPVYVDALVERDDTTTGGVSTERLYAQQDANYNTTSLIDTSGSVVERYEYDPYGSVTVMDASFAPVSENVSAYGMKYLHQGGRLDGVSGLYYFVSRDYSPTLGRWIQQDPAGYVNGLNTYQLELSNPAILLDPMGLEARLAPPAPPPEPPPPSLLEQVAGGAAEAGALALQTAAATAALWTDPAPAGKPGGRYGDDEAWPGMRGDPTTRPTTGDPSTTQPSSPGGGSSTGDPNTGQDSDNGQTSTEDTGGGPWDPNTGAQSSNQQQDQPQQEPDQPQPEQPPSVPATQPSGQQSGTPYPPTQTSPGRGVGGKGWRGDKNWRKAVDQTSKGGTIESIDGNVPTEQEAKDLIQAAGGTIDRIEGPHQPPNPHQYDHINYTTADGNKGTIQIQGTE